MTNFSYLSLALMALSIPALADDMIVVANPSITVTGISADDLKLVFLGSKTSVGGSSVEPVLSEKGAAHEAFLKKYVGKSDSALRMYFKSQVFSGKGSMPKSFADDAAIVQYVTKTKGAIAYVAPSAAVGSLKTIAIK